MYRVCRLSDFLVVSLDRSGADPVQRGELSLSLSRCLRHLRFGVSLERKTRHVFPDPLARERSLPSSLARSRESVRFRRLGRNRRHWKKSDRRLGFTAYMRARARARRASVGASSRAIFVSAVFETRNENKRGESVRPRDLRSWSAAAL